MGISPTQRTLAWLRADGYTAGVVEKWIPQTKRRLDLFGCIDIIAVRGPETVGVQATSTSNVQSRVKKIRATPDASAWLKGGTRTLIVIGWKRYAKPVNRKRWRPTVVPVEGGE